MLGKLEAAFAALGLAITGFIRSLEGSSAVLNVIVLPMAFLATALLAAGGLLVNLISLSILHGMRQGSLNARGAYLHVMGDALGSVGGIAADAEHVEGQQEQASVGFQLRLSQLEAEPGGGDPRRLVEAVALPLETPVPQVLERVPRHQVDRLGRGASPLQAPGEDDRPDLDRAVPGVDPEVRRHPGRPSVVIRPGRDDRERERVGGGSERGDVARHRRDVRRRLDRPVGPQGSVLGAAQRLEERLGVPGGDPASALWDLAKASNVPTRLADLKGDLFDLCRGTVAGRASEAVRGPPGAWARRWWPSHRSRAAEARCPRERSNSRNGRVKRAGNM